MSLTSRYAYLDFEYNGTTERNLRLVCCSLIVDEEVSEYWLHGKVVEGDISHLRAKLQQLKDFGYTLVAYNVEAEASSFISMGVDPLGFEWLDLYLEYRLLQNHNRELLYGKQLFNGKIKVAQIGYLGYGEKGKQNLAAAAYKLCGIIIDTDHKDKMRDIIIRGDFEEIEANRADIQAYCTSDARVLSAMLTAIKQQIKKKVPAKMLGMVKSEAKWRAEYAVRTAIMVRHGYPINVEWGHNLTESIPFLLRECIEDINEQFPEIRPFKFNRKDCSYSLDTKACKSWIRTNHSKWGVTDSGDLSLALEAWEYHYNFRHEFPRGNFGAQMVRWFKLKQSLSSFNFKEGSESFWDSVGTDGFARPYMNIYGAQSSRSQPKTKGFLFLKSAWCRALCQAPEGYAIGAIDYSSQEVLLGAILSGDLELFSDYVKGDIYLAYGKRIGVIPPDGTKSSHGKERDAQKPVILGWQYWITGYGLSAQLKNQTGKDWLPEDAQELLNTLDATYSTFARFRERTVEEYQARKYLKLLDGWYMWGDNPSARSAANCISQGAGACIMRKAVALAQDAGLKVIFTLHDALYIMFKHDDIEAMSKLRECMKEAFIHYFEGKQKEMASVIRMDGKAWSQHYQDGKIRTKTDFVVETSQYHIDPRAKKEYNLFSKYFLTKPSVELL